MEAKIYNYNTWIQEVQNKTLFTLSEKLLKQAGFDILKTLEHHFQPQGYTAIWLLAESHFALHTFPEEYKTYIELSSCNREMYECFIENLPQYFEVLSV